MASNFELERVDRICGSDLKDLLGLEPFGCRRRLMYDKALVPPDAPRVETADMRRGIKLEPLAVEEYEAATGRKCRVVGFLETPGLPLGVHIDRLIEPTSTAPVGLDDGVGVLEVKCPSLWFWTHVRTNGMPLDWQLQCQWGMLHANAAWGSIWAFCSDKWRGFHVDQARDDGLLAQLQERALDFWDDVLLARAGSLDTWPDRLKPTDPRCRSCQWRQTCHGQAPSVQDVPVIGTGETIPVDLSMDSLAQAYLDAKEVRDKADEQVLGIRSQIDVALDGRTDVDTGSAIIRARKISTKPYSVGPKEYVQITVMPKAANGRLNEKE